MNQTLQDPFPKDIQVTGIGSWSATLQPLIPQINDTDYESFIRSNITYINGEYQCRFWYPVGWGEFRPPSCPTPPSNVTGTGQRKGQ